MLGATVEIEKQIKWLKQYTLTQEQVNQLIRNKLERALLKNDKPLKQRENVQGLR